MVEKHLTDEEIQQYLLEAQLAGSNTGRHLTTCKDCQEKATAYEMLFAALKQEEQPAFTFDLVEEVVAQLPKQPIAVQKDHFPALIILSLVIAGGLAGYIFRSYLAALFEGMAAVAIYLVAISAIIILLFFCLDMFKNHQKKMQALDMV